MKQHIERVESGQFSHSSYLGNIIQNELIASISTKIMDTMDEDEINIAVSNRLKTIQREGQGNGVPKLPQRWEAVITKNGEYIETTTYITRNLKNQWWRDKAKEIQQLADANDSRGFFSATKAIFGPSTSGQAPLRSKDGSTILKSNAEINARWKEHFEDLLNQDTTFDSDVLNSVPKQPIQDSLSNLSTLAEVKEAIKTLKNNKAAGLDGIPAEIYKIGGNLLHYQLHQLLIKIWTSEELPSDLRDSAIITIYKRKGDRSECGNYRGISLLATAEKCREQYQPLYMAFIDLTKAFDSVSRELLWNTLSTYGCPPKYIRIPRLLHDGETVQSCPSQVQNQDILLQYADDNIIAALSEEDLQRILNAFNKVYISLGLTINSKKTQILYQPSPNDPTRREPSIKLGETTLENVDHFPYLGSHLSSNLDLNDEIQHRLKCAGTAFRRLRNRIFQDHDIRTDTKMAVYNAVVIPTPLYASKTWTTYRRHLDTLEKFHQRCLRSILNISWEDRRTNVSVPKAANATSIEAHIIKSQLRWSGHVVRMSDDCLPKQIFYSQLKEGNRKEDRRRDTRIC
ncbi:uncharacterized protein LOC143025712 [Oratosquilla oratoria]|uniref:uncharacterized protein LOC143025712 n=1 Tax=Oratosquilla oratoria TaxID=337810 RepID=UPI003F775EAB